jgi:hypothetical protein
MKTVQICKAEPAGGRIVESITLEISQELRGEATKWDNSSLEEAERVFTEQATLIENALIDTLPGGVYSRLLGLMLKRKASYFIVPLNS